MQVAASATVLPGDAIAALVEASPLKEAVARVVVIDGVVARQLSDTDRLPQQVRRGTDFVLSVMRMGSRGNEACTLPIIRLKSTIMRVRFTHDADLC